MILESSEVRQGMTWGEKKASSSDQKGGLPTFRGRKTPFAGLRRWGGGVQSRRNVLISKGKGGSFLATWSKGGENRPAVVHYPKGHCIQG